MQPVPLILSWFTGILMIVYMALVGTTLWFAHVHTSHTRLSSALEARVTTLERDYFDALTALGALDPLTYGLSTPVRVVYIEDAGVTLTQAP